MCCILELLHLCAIKKDHLSVYCLGNVIKYERGSREQTVGLHAQFTILANMLGQCVDRDMNCVRYIILNHNDVPTLPFHTSPLLKKHEHPPSEKKKKTHTHTKQYINTKTGLPGRQGVALRQAQEVRPANDFALHLRDRADRSATGPPLSGDRHGRQPRAKVGGPISGCSRGSV